jgi:drug/metabolite transporter (DMT)-like permease
MDARQGWVLAPLVAAALWGGMYVVSKWGFAAVPPVTLVFLRVAVGAAVLLAAVRVVYPSRRFSRRDLYDFAVLGVWIAISMTTQFVGTDLTTASEGALITVLTPVFTFVLGIARLGESATPRNTLGLVVALAGTVVVVAGQYDLAALGAGSVLGIGLLVVASLTWAGYTVWGAPLIRKYSALETATYSTAVAVPLVAPGVVVEWHVQDVTLSAIPVTVPIVAAVGYLGVLSTALAWYCWYKGLEFVAAGTVAVFFFAQPIVGTALGAVFLGESLGPGFVIGGLVMAGGVYLVSTDETTTIGD